MAKKFVTSISICYVQEKNPFSFFSQICLFQTFYSHIYPQNVKFFYMAIQMEFKQKYFNCLLLLRFQISLLPKIFPIKKTAAFCVFCGLRYSSDNLLSFDTNALYFVRPLYNHYTVSILNLGFKTIAPKILAHTACINRY